MSEFVPPHRSTPPLTPGLVAEALSKLPERIHIGAYPMKLQVIPSRSQHKHVVWGQFESDTQTIWLNDEFPSLTFMAMIFIHELLHAVWWAQGISDQDDKEERVVTLLGTGLTQVFRDNPWLMPWIDDCYRFDRGVKEKSAPLLLTGPDKKPKAKRRSARRG